MSSKKEHLNMLVMGHVDNGKSIEPFMGTGVVGFNSGFEYAIMNDINPHIVNFYRNVQSGDITPETARLYLEREGEALRNSADEGQAYYREVRSRFNRNGFDPMDFLFLSRACFNGVMRFNSSGGFNVPFCKNADRFAPAYVTKICNLIAGTARAMRPSPAWLFTNVSFERVIEHAHAGDLIYCDPPYFGRTACYHNEWGEKDEERLFAMLASTDAKFMMSAWHHDEYRTNPMVERYCGNLNVITMDHTYRTAPKAENRRAVVEALICNFKVNGVEDLKSMCQAEMFL